MVSPGLAFLTAALIVLMQPLPFLQTLKVLNGPFGLLGFALGSAGVGYLAKYGINYGEGAAASVKNIPLATTLYARYVPTTFINLSLGTLAIILLASFYPAWFAARLEPVKALHAV